MLLSAAELGVDEGVALEVVEAEAVLFFLALGHPFALFGDAELVEQLLPEAAFFRPVAFQRLAAAGFGSVEHGTPEVRGQQDGFAVAVYPFLPPAFFGIVGDVQGVAAVVAVAQSLVEVYG
ncbi:uncharacterized protein BN507_01156 [Bacteroides clarus CAG:160]|nr:uncharacterized protein BN507_01156 [Bacteroides clarus CAG:160]